MKKNLKYIGENIRQLRINKGLTIEELAEQANISESFLGLVERGVSGVSVETVINISNVLEITTDSILIDKNVKKEEADNKIKLIALIQNSSEKELDFLIEYIKLYRKKELFK